MEESAGGRSKRQKIDRHGRLSAFEKLKQLKGSKRKYEVETLENVYDTVDEREYTERVLQRQEEDWIDDDGGNGYVEDGREIFDDDDDPVDAKDLVSSENDRTKKRKTRVAPLADEGPVQGKKSIRSMLTNMQGKKKEDVKLSEDDILTDIMSELKSEPSSSKSCTPKGASSSAKVLRTSNIMEHSRRDAQDYFKSLSAAKPKKLINSFSKNGDVKVKDVPVIKKEVEEEEKLDIFDAPSPKKMKSHTVAVKIEEEDDATQRIEEFNTQDMHFDDIDFDTETLDETVVSEKTKKECLSDGKIEKKVLDELNAADFLNSNLEIFDEVLEEKKPAHKITNGETSNGWSSPGQSESFGAKCSANYDTSTLPLSTNKDGDKVLKFYWWDAWEDKYMKPGVVFLFGKVYIDHLNPSKGCVSCCLTVRNVDRRLFLLPREYKLDPITLEEDSDHPVSIMDVYSEFNTAVSSRLGIKEFKSRKVTKNYAFDLPNIPSQAEYLEVKYGATHPAPPTDKPYQTFSHIFGINTGSLETFLLEQKIRGPCWLEVKNPECVGNKISWCKAEANCVRPEDIAVLREETMPPPPLVIATINTRMVVDPKTKASKIVMISCLVNNGFEIHKPTPNPFFHQHFCVFTHAANEIWPIDLKQTMSQFKGTKLTKCDSERELLNYFLVQFWKIDADLIVGHDLQGYQQDLLIGNIVDKNIPNWSRLGRLKRSTIPQRKYISKDAFLGRLVCDIKLSAMELIRSRSFDLDTLCMNILKVPEGTRTEVIADELFKYYEKGSDLMQLVSLTMQDASYIMKIMCELNVLPLALQITQIAGNVMSRTLMGGRSERNEFLLLHAFNEKDYIVPDKIIGKRETQEITVKEENNVDDSKPKLTKKQTQARKKPAYSGGLVLDPKKGFYDSLVLLMDFNSLYPSIIQEYNICFTTIKRNAAIVTDDEINEMVLPESNVDPGILPTQIRRLVESRREVKKLMKTPDLSPEQYMQYNIRQLALKLTANSMYGCLGFTYSRFYAKPLAALVTLKGREILINTKDLVQKLNYDVIYGDTDSIMINTNCVDYDQVFKIGHEIKKEINKKYRQVELDIDGVFKYLLLLKKKKYAAVLISKNKNGEFVTSQELKGIDVVRRDWSQLAAEAGKFILNQILSEQTPDERVESIQSHLSKLKDDLGDGKMPLSMMIITKQLTKNPHEFADKQSQPHVQVAVRLNSKNGRKFKKGDIVPYIICQDGTDKPATQRAYHIEELKNSENLKVDINYYLAHQLHPVISRICEPIEGMDSARIADYLGLDPSAYKHIVKRENSDEDDLYRVKEESEKYRQCDDFVFTCVSEKCKMINKVHESFQVENNVGVSFLDKCQNEQCNVKPVDYLPTILNQLTKLMRSYNAKYYENWLTCEDPACTNRTASVPHMFAGGYPVCNVCEKGVMFREYTERDLYYQMSFFCYLFDVNKHNTKKVKISPQITAAFHTLKESVEDVLSQSAYSVIDLSSLFSFFAVKPKTSVTIKKEPSSLELAPDMEMDEHDAYWGEG